MDKAPLKPQQILIATRNLGKIDEFSALLKDLNLEMISLDELGIKEEVEEDGRSFRENAIKKATIFAWISRMLTLADDSGLEVDALGGRPGVMTARFGGPDLLPEERYRYLLDLMTEIPNGARTARFHCVVALALPDGLVADVHAHCEGTIAYEPAGQEGFGYDPIFYLPEYGKTMAELQPGKKHLISHRGQAIEKIKPKLRNALTIIR